MEVFELVNTAFRSRYPVGRGGGIEGARVAGHWPGWRCNMSASVARPLVCVAPLYVSGRLLISPNEEDPRRQPSSAEVRT